MPVDLRKFPLLASENTKLPLDNLTYRSRLKNFYVDDADTKNYIATAFRNFGDVIQAGELNEIYERQTLYDTLTHQMWSNWSAFIYPPDGAPLAPAPTFGPGWAGTTPLYPGAFDANSTALAGADGVNDTRPYSQVEAALLFKTVDIDDVGSGYLQANIKLLFNTGWYLINDTSFVTPKYFQPVTQNTLYDRVVQASGLKHWYYLKQPILFDIILAGFGQTGFLQNTPELLVSYDDSVPFFFGTWRNSTKFAYTFGSGSAIADPDFFKKNITNRHDGAYFALDLADKSLCQHIDPVNCDEDLTDEGSVSDSNPIQTTDIVNDPFFANPINVNASDDGNSRRVQIKALPRYRHGTQHNIDPANLLDPDLNNENITDARSRTTNIVIGNMNLTQSNPSVFHDKVPSHSLCVKCEPNTEGLTNAISNMNDYVNVHAPNGTPLETFDLNEFKDLRNAAFQQMKEGLKPRFINNVRVNTTIYDVDEEGQTDAENEWNSHFSELGDVLRIVESTDLRQVEPI